MVALRTLFETPAAARLLADDYIDSPFSDEKSDLIEGVMIVATPASYEHERLQCFIMLTLGLFVETRGLGQVMGSNLAFRMSDVNVYQPDVSFIRRDRLHLAREVYFAGPPDIAVEIVSPSSRHYDEVEKKINYARFGVGEYWLIDPLTRQAVFYSQVNGQFVPVASTSDRVQSEILAGYWLQRDWLFPPSGAKTISAVEAFRLMANV